MLVSDVCLSRMATVSVSVSVSEDLALDLLTNTPHSDSSARRSRVTSLASGSCVVSGSNVAAALVIRFSLCWSAT